MREWERLPLHDISGLLAWFERKKADDTNWEDHPDVDMSRGDLDPFPSTAVTREVPVDTRQQYSIPISASRQAEQSTWQMDRHNPEQLRSSRESSNIHQSYQPGPVTSYTVSANPADDSYPASTASPEQLDAPVSGESSKAKTLAQSRRFTYF